MRNTRAQPTTEVGQKRRAANVGYWGTAVIATLLLDAKCQKLTIANTLTSLSFRAVGSCATTDNTRWKELAMATPELSNEDAQRLREFERRSHDQLAGSYCDFFTSVTTLAAEPLLDAADVASGARVLDVATGPGSLVAAAVRRGAQPVGVDLSSKMIELARQKYPSIEFHEADVERLPFPEQAFDAVVCGFGLGHFPRPEAAAAECVRALKNGGRIALAWWDDFRKQRIQGLFRESVAEIGLAPPAEIPPGHSSQRYCDGAEFHRLLHQAGLADIRLEDHHTTHLVESVSILWRGGLGSMVQTGAAIRGQTEETQEAVRRAFERRAQEYACQEGLRIPIAFRVGSGRKAAISFVSR
jgi:SAM-dependent methyltransferase